MSKTPPTEKHSLKLVSVSATSSETYSLEDASRLSGLHPELIRYYCQQGLLGNELAGSQTELIFDDNALYELRRYEHYRQHHGLNRRTLRLLCHLWREVDRLQIQLRFQRKE